MCLPIIRMQTCQVTESQTADRRHWCVHKHYRVVYALLTAGGSLFARPSRVDVCVCEHVCVCVRVYMCKGTYTDCTACRQLLLFAQNIVYRSVSRTQARAGLLLGG